MKLIACLLAHVALALLAQGEAEPCALELDELVESLTVDVQDAFVPPVEQSCQRETVEWKENEKLAFAKSTYESLMKPLQLLGRVQFKNMVFGVKCRVANELRVIVQFKASSLGNCTTKMSHSKCVEKHKNPIYCTWIGTVQNQEPAKTLGAVCFHSTIISLKDELDMAWVDVCNDWKYGETQFYRLAIPEQLSKSKTRFLLYNPPLADTLDERSADIRNMNADDMPLNPEGKTGIAGRGMLRKLGENILEIPIIRRKVGKSTQVLLASQHNAKYTVGPLPTFHQNAERSDNQRDRSELSFEEYFHGLVKPEYRSNCTLETFQLALRSNSKTYRQYMPHPYTTDNAWVIGLVRVIKTKYEPCFDGIDLDHKANYLHYKWTTFNRSTVDYLKDAESISKLEEVDIEEVFNIDNEAPTAFSLTDGEIAEMVLNDCEHNRRGRREHRKKGFHTGDSENV
uniref:Uncharacterized protein n=1 Tax=Trichuris muris TaxID=70415 RepID=A0A5S6Q1S9_TRIMR